MIVIFSFLSYLTLTLVSYQKKYDKNKTILLNISLSILFSLVLFNKIHLNTYLFFHFSLFILLFFLSKTKTTSLIWRLISLYLFTLSLTFILSSYELIFYENFYITLNNDRFLSTLFFICSLLLLFIFEILIQKHMTKEHVNFILSTTTLPLAFLITLLLLVKKLAYLSVILYTKHSYEVNLTLFIALLLEIFFNIAIFKLLIKSYDFSVFKYQQKILNMQYELESSYYEQLENHQLHLRKIAHDIHHHQTVLRHYLEENQVNKAIDYLEDYTIHFKSSHFSRYTSHPILNALLNKKEQQCQKLNIDFTFDIKVPKELPISDFDLCILLGNLLDNALEATTFVTKNSSFIQLQMCLLNTQLVIIVQNNFEQNPKKRNGRFNTTKSDKLYHGLGLSNVEQVIHNYQGIINFEAQQQIFKVTALIPIN